MIRKIFLILAIILIFAGCVNTRDVTQEGVESFGSDIFKNFVYYVSKNVILREAVDVGGNLTLYDAGEVTLINKEVYLSNKARGRVLNASSDRIEVTFEEFPDGSRPTIAFVRNPDDQSNRYFIEFTMREVMLIDERGSYGYIKEYGPVVSYNGKRYLLTYNGKDIPYLLQELDIKILNESRNISGVR